MYCDLCVIIVCLQLFAGDDQLLSESDDTNFNSKMDSSGMA